MRIALACALALYLSTAAQPAAAQALSTQEMYKACTDMATSKPQEAAARARKWYEESKQSAALHCLALAQFELKDYTGAAASLEAVLASLSKTQNNLWLSITKQAATAQRNAQNGEAAERHLSEALRYISNTGHDREMIPLLLDRARIYTARNENLRAIQDLDHALSIQPAIQIMLERARVYLNMADFETAETDIRKVLKADPLNEEASKLLGELERKENALKNGTPEAAAAPTEDNVNRQAQELEALERRFQQNQRKR